MLFQSKAFFHHPSGNLQTSFFIAFKLCIQFDQAGSPEWMSFLPFNLTKKMNLIQKPSVQIPKAYNQHGLAKNAKNYLVIKHSNTANCIAYILILRLSIRS